MAIHTSDGKSYEDEVDYHFDRPMDTGQPEDKNDFTQKFNTPLTSEEQQSFNQKFGNNPKDLYDYDLQGFHKANPDFNREEGQHLTDQFKKPNHPTFSDQSQYSGGEYQGGTWNQLGEDRFGFTPGRTNIETHGYKGLQDYFKKVEPGNVLNPSPEPKKIYFVRHGETDLNKESGENSHDQPVRGWSNVPLNQQGIKEAQKAADSVKDLPIDHIVASDLPRARQTANIIGNKLGLIPEFDSGLRTWNLGEHTGKAGKEVHDEVNRLCSEAQDEKPKGGESFNEFKNRILGTMSSIVQRHSDKELLIVSHNSPERILHAWTEAGQPQKNLLNKKLQETGEESIKPEYDTQGFDLYNRDTGIKPLDIIKEMVDPYASDEKAQIEENRKELREGLDRLGRKTWGILKEMENKYGIVPGVEPQGPAPKNILDERNA